ncbi:nitroreductase/quinone reductase family protein [Saccharomonospora piscinae]|uniref:nitroreductase/quinone reductase family protein n=1 Tax=Saccharomonospora piscinae TaxID=687388 RepID=UPI000466E708|nr:nitroreductase/quinone reductase family protein [Saccharomonospora piscinae]
MPHTANQHVIAQFRAHDGEVGGPFTGARLLLLTTTGARSGAPHTVPLGYLHDGQGSTLVIGSAAGAPHHPAWYHNLLAEPRVTVETGAFTYEAEAEVLRGSDRDEAFARAVEADPAWGEYQAATSRVLPVVRLRPVRAVTVERTWGQQTKLIHDVFRREMALVRAEVAHSGPGLGAQLRINCLTLCQGLRHHHTGEDEGTFPVVETHHPELAPALRRLRAEHETLARLLGELEDVLRGDTGSDEVRARVDDLTLRVEAHLDWEEEQLLTVLDGLTDLDE